MSTNWTRVLSPLKTSHLSQPKDTIDIDTIAGDGSMSNDLAKKLKSQHEENKRKETVVKRQTKNDYLSTPCSQWRLSDFEKYVPYDENIENLTPSGSTTQVANWDLNMFEDVLKQFGKIRLSDCRLRKRETRVFLDLIVTKLCKEHGLRVKMEEDSKLKYLPQGRFDYLITKDGVPLGCIEAKSPAGMEIKSVCQAVLELNIVQQLALKKGVDEEKTPLFCILSDGYRFIFMQLKGKKLRLEHTTDNLIKIRKLDGQEVFKEAISIFKELITSSLKELC